MPKLAGTLQTQVPTFHVTTFGCQMNEHDSERMKGMLESLGLPRSAAARRSGSHPLQHVLDPREGRRALRLPPPRGAQAQATRSRADHRRRRLLGPVGQGAGLPPVPVRRRRVRPRPGPQARRVPDQRQPDRPGLLRVRGLHRPSARQARPRLPGLGADLRRLQHEVRVLHRAVDPRPRGVSRPLEELVAEIEQLARTASARSRCSARTSTRTARACARSRAASPSCCTPSTRSRASTASATRARTPRT